jgi:hypothetical protein
MPRIIRTSLLFRCLKFSLPRFVFLILLCETPFAEARSEMVLAGLLPSGLRLFLLLGFSGRADLLGIVDRK